MKLAANFFSYLLHPIWLPSLGVAYYLWCNPYFFAPISSKEGAYLMSLVISQTVIMPLVGLLLMKQLNVIKDLKIEDRKERLLPYLAMEVFLFLAYYNFKQFPYPEALADVLLGAALTVLGLFIMSAFYNKMSAHAAGMGNLVALVMYSAAFSIYTVSPFLMGAIILAGLAGTARLLLNVHTNREVYMGYFLGFLCQLVAFIV